MLKCFSWSSNFIGRCKTNSIVSSYIIGKPNEMEIVKKLIVRIINKKQNPLWNRSLSNPFSQAYPSNSPKISRFYFCLHYLFLSNKNLAINSNSIILLLLMWLIARYF